MSNKTTAKYQLDESRFFSTEEGRFLRKHISPDITYIAYAFLGSFESSERDKVKSLLHEYAKWKREREEDPKRLRTTDKLDANGLSNLDRDFCKDYAFQWIEQHGEMDNADVYIKSIKVSEETVSTIKKLRQMLIMHQYHISAIRIKDGLSTILDSEGLMRGGLHKLLGELKNGDTSKEVFDYAREASKKLEEIEILRKNIEHTLFPEEGEVRAIERKTQQDEALS